MAHDFCITNAAELQQALTAASDGGAYVDEDNLLTLVFGTYRTGAATGGGPFFFHTTTSTHRITIYGGFSAGCSGDRHLASETHVDGHNASGAMVLRSAHGQIAVTHLTFENGESDQPGAGLQVNYLVSVNASVNIDHVIIRNNHTTASAGGLYASGSATGDTTAVSLLSSLIHDNSADVDNGGVYITGYGNITDVLNSTITRNHAPGTTTVGGLFCGGTAGCSVLDSIVWNNSNVGIYFDVSGAVVCDDYGALGGMPPDYTADNVSVQPNFVDAAGGDFHLSDTSPLFGKCFGGTGGTDLEDHSFGRGREDMGAYNDTLFADGFDD